MVLKTKVTYTYRFPYRNLPGHTGQFPVVPVMLSASRSVDAPGVIDTGSQRTIFDGGYASTIGLRLEDGTSIPIQPFGNGTFFTKALRCHIFFNGQDMELDVCFSEIKIPRNILGRDFLDRVQMGLREHHELVFLRPEP